jgi:hypothetical protein
VLPWFHLPFPLTTREIISIPEESYLLPVGGSEAQAVVQGSFGQLLLTRVGKSDGTYILHRLNSSLADNIREDLFEGGLGALLDAESQASLREQGAAGVTTQADVEDRTGLSVHDSRNPNALYWREMFLEAPLYCATLAMQQGQHELAARFCRYVIDFTKDQALRYAPFATLDTERLREALTDPEGQQIVEHDPFNPFAWAQKRERQRAIGAAFLSCENMLDHADVLYGQLQREPVEQACTLYQMVLEILGKEPVIRPDCSDEGSGRTYGEIREMLDDGLLGVSEDWLSKVRDRKLREAVSTLILDPHADIPAELRAEAERIIEMIKEAMGGRAYAVAKGRTMRTTLWKKIKASAPGDEGVVGDVLGVDSSKGFVASRLMALLSMTADGVPLFCIPDNPKLIELRERANSGLARIRSCRDEIPPFAPEIPVDLVLEAQAAGISLQEVLGAESGRIPPFRFVAAIALFKAHAADFASLCASYYGATQSLQGEERNIRELQDRQNLTRLSTRVVRDNLLLAEKRLEAANVAGGALAERLAYLESLIATGLLPKERMAYNAREQGLQLRVLSYDLGLVSSLLHLIPQVGAPTAMTFGGRELGGSVDAFSKACGGAGGISEAKGGLAMSGASDLRRLQGWEHERSQIQRRIEQNDRELEAASLAVRIAERNVVIQERTGTQLDELLAHQRSKVVGRAAFAAQKRLLGRLMPNVLGGVVQLGKLAERCLRYERGRDAPGLSLRLFDRDAEYMHAAHELLAAANTMQLHFEQTHRRKLEIDQMFALSQIAPDALWRLKTSGDATFTVGLWPVISSYPGVLNCRIRGVRLTVNAILPPYANIPVTLELLQSYARRGDPDGDGSTTEELIPPEHTARIATSRAQNDAGLFQLDFSDPRYLPFEGGSPINSKWRIRLPKHRRFDFYSISDVVLSIAYEADYNEALRGRDEALNDTAMTALGAFPHVRVISLRDSFGAEFGRLLRSPVGTLVPFTIEERHFEYWLHGRSLTLQRASLHIITVDGTAPAGPWLSINGTEINEWTAESSDLGMLMSSNLDRAIGSTPLSTHTIKRGTELGNVRDLIFRFEMTLDDQMRATTA